MWLYHGAEFTEDLIGESAGFVYKITNNASGRMYIGKKLFTFAKTKQVKGKKKRSRVASDWQEYWSSSDDLKADVASLGEDKFTREILYLCKNKGLMSYVEAREQFDNRVLENPDKWYNGIINCRVHRTHIKALHAA
jgi:hypothetical protein